MTSSTESIHIGSVEAPEDSKFKKILRFIAWTLFALICLVFFTLIQLPSHKIHQSILGFANQQLSPLGYQLQSDSGEIKIGFGIRYEMKDLKITKISNSKQLKISKLTLSPQILPLLMGDKGLNLEAQEGSGQLKLVVNGKLPEGSVDLEATDLNLGKMGLIPFLSGIEGSALITEAKSKLSGDLSQPSTLSGDVRINLSKVLIQAQNFMGFNLPETSIKDGVVDVNLAGGKVKINTARLGKSGDDISLQLTGDLKLNKFIPSSELNLKSKIAFSETFLKAIPLLDTILGAGKTPDGSYGFKLAGSLGSPFPSPDK